MNATTWSSNFLQDLTTNFDDIAGNMTDVIPVRGIFKPFKMGKAFRIYAVFIAMIGVVGILSNGLTLVVLSRTKKTCKSSALRLIVHQCWVDLVTSVLMLVGYTYHAFQKVTYHGLIGKVLCVLFGGDCLVWVALNTSTLHLIVITLERYARVRLPVCHRNNINLCNITAALMACVCIAAVWTVSFSVQGTILIPPGFCLSMVKWPSRVLSNTFSFGSFVIFFAIPLMLFCCLYTHMFVLLVKKNSKVAPLTLNQLPSPAPPTNDQSEVITSNDSRSSRRKLSRTQINITKTMISVCLVYVICWAPMQITFLLFNLGVAFNGYIYYYQILLFLAFLNSCLNPFIYAVKLVEFRKGFYSLLEKTMREPATSSTGDSNRGNV